MLCFVKYIYMHMNAYIKIDGFTKKHERTPHAPLRRLSASYTWIHSTSDDYNQIKL